MSELVLYAVCTRYMCSKESAAAIKIVGPLHKFVIIMPEHAGRAHTQVLPSAVDGTFSLSIQPDAASKRK